VPEAEADITPLVEPELLRQVEMVVLAHLIV